MHLIRHLCGQELERGTGAHGAYFELVPFDARSGRYQQVERCPACGEALCDTDMTDRAGHPLVVNNPSAWSINRRAALTGLAGAGYTLRYAAGFWRIRAADRDYDSASTATLDAMIELAAAISAGRQP